MKLGKITLAIATFTLGITSASAGTLTTSSNVNILAFDGQKVKKNTVLQINDTQQHQVVVEVSSIYQSGSDNQFYESAPLVVTFAGSQENIQIIAPTLRNDLEVEKFKKSPTFKIQTASGQALEYKQDELKGEGFMPNANIVDNLATYNTGNGVAAVKSLAVTAMPIAIAGGSNKVAKGKVMVQGENIAEQQLQYWFQQADKETQKRFLDWAKKQ
ncbi:MULTISPECIES: DUF2057 domain-containing protein [Glaesserella]|uniref:UPF0319 protein C5N92_08255 n=1 Tax=Glaesserella australis TaxID=2094024 RepID=A0A328C142_9PAST|nr:MULTISPECIES: DUF2057 domain-containing protein [Glaesserella]AUI66076.1 hypothetical protein CJD39_05545 [Glaesserella sp. 15-184]RAL18204.1 hypothetical protein C5N92_08255 [Glaesserella australis]